MARETAARVELWLRETIPSRPGVCNVMMAIANSQAIRLKAPLGRRPPADARTWAGSQTAIRVHGLPGQATRNLITWRENGLTDLIVVARPQWTQVLTTTRLVAMADST